MNTPDDQPLEPWLDADRETQSQAGGEPDQPSQFILQRNGQLGHFSLQRQLGGGGFGNVYLAWDNKLRREVAIKVPRWDRPLTPKTQERFLHEGRMLAQVDHPSIAAVYEVGITDDGLPFVVMSYVRGRSLSECLKQSSWSVDDKLGILIQIADTLQQAHKQGLTHRDLKPANIIVNDQLRIAIVDFGLALHDDLAPSQIGDASAVGTPVYMAPEQIRGENHLIDGRTDIWALGVVMYVLLTQRLPFSSRDHRELIRTICYKHPRPLRQLNDRIPHELERICLRCLQKLMDDRYPSMADVRDELQAYIVEQRDQLEAQRVLATQLSRPSVQTLQSISRRETSPAAAMVPESNQSGPTSGASSPSASSGSPSSSRVLAEIVPRGLRAFDQNDSEFFLQLLPGPVDRHGIPQSLRFLLSRLGSEQQVDSIPIMVIYGPSGSGKSSLIRAGLIPRLPSSVIPIYIDCTTENLCHTIRERLHREFVDMRSVSSLPELIRQIRQGNFLRSQDKLLLVLDQFEQWLSRPEALEPNELTEALRQCEANRIQVVLLLRDDFWMTATLFLKELGQRIEDGRNALVIPLFDERHARRVLEMFGRAHGALPSGTTPLSKPQKKFIEQAVAAISKQGRVVCIHLVVLAETIKDREWGQRDYQSLGGWEGIGREYIAGIFNNLQTPSYVKRHAKDAWLILQSLLPQLLNHEQIKGQALRLASIQERAGLIGQDTRFQELIRFLEVEARLIAPLEDENVLEQSSASNAKPSTDSLYGLTHDFLVAPIRAWGQAIQNESPAGRAEQLLQQLAQQWEMTGDKRFLPSFWDAAKIWRYTDGLQRNRYTPFWQATIVKVRTQLTVAAAVLIAMVALGLGINQFVYRAQIRNDAKSYLFGPVADAHSFIDKFPDFLRHALDVFEANLQSNTPSVKLRSSCLLATHSLPDRKHLDLLFAQLGDVDPSEFELVKESLRPFADKIVPMMSTFCEGEGESAPIASKSRVAILAQLFGDHRYVLEASRLQSDANQRSQLIEDWIQCVTSFEECLQQIPAIDSETTGPFWQAFFSSLAARDATTFYQLERQRILDIARQVYENHPNAGAHAAAMHLLKKNQALPRVPPNLKAEAKQWTYIHHRSGKDSWFMKPILFVKIPPGKFPTDTNWQDIPTFFPMIDGTIEQPYWMGASEIPLEIFEVFRQTIPADDPDFKSLLTRTEFAKLVETMTAETSAGHISWIQAVRFCNWFSEKLGYESVYVFGSDQRWSIAPDRIGFRLPTWEESIRAQRAESTSLFFFGDSDRRLPIFVERPNSRMEGLANQYPPNGFGLFDISGNFTEWLSESKDIIHEGKFLYTEAYRACGYTGENINCPQSGYTTGGPNDSSQLTGLRLVFTGSDFNQPELMIPKD